MAECSQIKRLGFRALWLVWKNVWKNAERTEPKLVSGRCLHTRAARGAMTISQLFVLAPNGHTIVHKDYRGDVSKDAPEIFLRKVVDKLDAPIFTVDGVNYVCVRKNGITFLATAELRVNAAPIGDFRSPQWVVAGIHESSRG